MTTIMQPNILAKAASRVRGCTSLYVHRGVRQVVLGGKLIRGRAIVAMCWHFYPLEFDSYVIRKHKAKVPGIVMLPGRFCWEFM